jgi:hypothetical protein
MKNNKLPVITTALTLATLCSTQAQVLFSDSFTRVTGNTDPLAGPVDSNWGSNDNAAGGSIVQTYVTSPDRTSGGVQQTVNGSQGILRFGATAIQYDLYSDANVVAAGGYSLQFNFTRLTAANFVGVFFGAAPAAVAAKDGSAAFGPINQLTDYANTVEAAFLFQNNLDLGRVQKHSYGAQQGGNIDGAYDDATTGTVGLHLARVDVTSATGFGSGQTATFSLYIDGNFVTSHSAVLDGGLGTFGFTSNQGSATSGGLIDNIVVTVIPEPGAASLALLGGVLLMLAQRKTRC